MNLERLLDSRVTGKFENVYKIENFIYATMKLKVLFQTFILNYIFEERNGDLYLISIDTTLNNTPYIHKYNHKVSEETKKALYKEIKKI